MSGKFFTTNQRSSPPIRINNSTKPMTNQARIKNSLKGCSVLVLFRYYDECDQTKVRGD